MVARLHQSRDLNFASASFKKKSVSEIPYTAKNTKQTRPPHLSRVMKCKRRNKKSKNVATGSNSQPSGHSLIFDSWICMLVSKCIHPFPVTGWRWGTPCFHQYIVGPAKRDTNFHTRTKAWATSQPNARVVDEHSQAQGERVDPVPEGSDWTAASPCRPHS